MQKNNIIAEVEIYFRYRMSRVCTSYDKRSIAKSLRYKLANPDQSPQYLPPQNTHTYHPEGKKKKKKSMSGECGTRAIMRGDWRGKCLEKMLVSFIIVLDHIRLGTKQNHSLNAPRRKTND